MRGIKIPQQDFALKMPGGLMREVGRICGTLWYIIYIGVYLKRQATESVTIVICRSVDVFKILECKCLNCHRHTILVNGDPMRAPQFSFSKAPPAK